jgi:hypothetical protein
MPQWRYRLLTIAADVVDFIGRVFSQDPFGFPPEPRHVDALRRHYEKRRETMVGLKSAGLEFSAARRVVRIYDVEVEGRDGRLSTRKIGVEGVFDPQLWRYDERGGRRLIY